MMCLRSRNLKPRPGASALHKRIVSNNYYTYDEQGDDSRQEKDGSMVTSIIYDRC